MPTPRSQSGLVALWGLGAALLLVGPTPPVARGSADDGPPTGTWYTPKPSDFRGAYDRDPANAKTQTWDQYYGWVTSFYAGNLLSSGWTQRMSAEVAVVPSIPTREALVTRLNKVGIQIAGEWAKENAVRRLNTDDLKRWHAALSAARAAEDGSGDRLKSAIQTVEDEVARKLAKPSAPK